MLEEEPVLSEDLFAPFPYWGNKRRAAPLIWAALGDVPNAVFGFAGALGDLLGRPSTHHPKIETVNDADGQICNVWRALQQYPVETARAADDVVSELDLHARHAELVRRIDAAFVERLRTDARFCDPELAGWWIWGAALWIGGGWCAPSGGRSGNPSNQKKRPAIAGQGGRTHLGRGVHAESLPQKLPAIGGHDNGRPTPGSGVHAEHLGRKRPHLAGNGSARLGSGVHAAMLPKAPFEQNRHPRLRGREGTPSIGTGVHQSKLPHLAGPSNPLRDDGTSTGVGYGRGVQSSEIREDILGFFLRLSARLRRVRIVCGDFERVLTPAVTVSHGLTGIVLDPPYGDDAERCAGLYACDAGDIAPRAREFALKHGDDPRYRIALCGYEGEHDMPSTWAVVPWKSSGSTKNADRERLWLSPHCLGGTRGHGPLFEFLNAGGSAR